MALVGAMETLESASRWSTTMSRRTSSCRRSASCPIRRDRQRGPALHRAGVPGQPRRRSRGLDLRRARQEDHRASGVPQHRADDRAAVRCAARGPSRRQERPDLPDRVGRLHAPLLHGAAHGRGAGRRARCDRCVVADHLWLARPLARLQGGVPGTLGANADFYAPYQENARRWYRFSQERVPFINHAIIHPPVDRNMAPGRAGRAHRCLCPRHQGDGCRHPCERREGRGHRLGADALSLSSRITA